MCVVFGIQPRLLFDINPANPERNPAYIDGVFVHTYNLDGKAGVYLDTNDNKIKGRSEGCLLIAPGKNNWNKFIKQLQTVNKFHLILNRY